MGRTCSRNGQTTECIKIQLQNFIGRGDLGCLGGEEC
jgi:hypothetical protein